MAFELALQLNEIESALMSEPYLDKLRQRLAPRKQVAVMLWTGAGYCITSKIAAQTVAANENNARWCLLFLRVLVAPQLENVDEAVDATRHTRAAEHDRVAALGGLTARTMEGANTRTEMLKVQTVSLRVLPRDRRLSDPL